MILLLFLMLIVQLRPVQTYLAKEVLKVVSEKTDHEITLERVKISWIDHANLDQLLIKDLEGDTMLYAKSLEVNYQLVDLIQQEYLNIEEIKSNDLDLKLVKRSQDEKLNFSIFLNSLKDDKEKEKTKSIQIEEITLSDLYLSLKDLSKEPNKAKLDFGNLDFSVVDFELNDLTLKSDTITGAIIQMQGNESNSNFTIEEFSTVFRVSNSALSVDDLIFKTPTSHVGDSLEFFYSGLEDLGYFKDSVSFILHFENTRISKEDIRIITGSEKLKGDVSIDGIIWGTVGDFNIEETRFGYENSYFVGGLSCFGLPDLSKTFLLADITDSHLIPSDLKPYIGDYADNLQQMGRIDFTGSFAGFFNDFVARGDFSTDQGSVHSDINLKIPSDPTMMSYDGNLEFKEVNIGTFFKNDIVQVVNLKGAIKGKGIKRENSEFDLKALVYNSGLYGYVYDTVEADGKFAENFFEGTFSIKDPNCNLGGNAEIDLRNEHEVLKADLRIKTINSQNLNLSKRDFGANGHVKIEVNDLDIDNFTASLSIDSGEFRVDEKIVLLDSVRFIADLNKLNRVIKISLPGINSTIEGNFKISDAAKDLKIMSQFYASKLTFIDSVKNEGSGEEYKIKLIAQIDDISQYTDSLRIPVSLGGKTSIEGSFRQSKNANISLFLEADSLLVKDNVLLNPTLEVNGSEDVESETILTSFIFQSSDQILARVPYTKDLLLEGVWYDSIITLRTLVDQPETKSNFRLESSISLERDSLIFKMLPSELLILDEYWKFEKANQVVLTKEKIDVENFKIYNSKESIAIEGIYADSIPTSITISTNNLNINKVELFTEASVEGFLDGNFKMFRETSKESFRFDGGFLLKQLVYDDINLGNIRGTSNWDPSEKRIYTKVDVERKDINTIDVEGYYYPSRELKQLDFNILFDNADLRMAQPALGSIFSNISGYADGALKLSGTLNEPRVVGNCQVQDGGATVTYLNTTYNFNGSLGFDEKAIKFNSFNLKDRKGANGVVAGSIMHESFKDMVLDLSLRANNFEFLNTTSLDNELYYGTAYGTGVIDITGPVNDLKIAANVKTDAATKIFIPISDGTNTTQQEYISFVDFSDSTEVVIDEEDFNISGLTLDFDIEITPEAYCELIFDIKTGDIIRGRGRGNLKLRLNTDGEFNMFGPLEITEGAYNFTVPNFINKEFAVTSGSTITWYGDPYNAILDLDATYLQRASFEELKNPENREQDELSIKVPILVILGLEGGLLSPTINFDLQLQNQADADTKNVPLLSQITSDEQELKRQVISLLFLKRFSPRQSFTLSGGGSVGNSVSEFLSSQVSYLVSQIDENLEVEVDLADLNRDAFNTFQLRFAYTFLDGRLKVTRGGNFGSEDDNNENVLNDIVGDWSVEYSLTKDGRLRAKAFRNTSQRILAQDNQQNQETGLSLRFVHSFDDFSELLSLKRDEAILRREEENSQQDSTGKTDSSSPDTSQ